MASDGGVALGEILSVDSAEARGEVALEEDEVLAARCAEGVRTGPDAFIFFAGDHVHFGEMLSKRFAGAVGGGVVNDPGLPLVSCEGSAVTQGLERIEQRLAAVVGDDDV